MATVAIVGGTSGLGLEIARHYADRGVAVVITGRDSGRANEIAAKVGGQTRGLGLDLARPNEIAAALSDVDSVGSLVLTAIERDENTIADFDIAAAQHLVMLKLVGYLTVVHTLRARLSADASILLFGGQARVRPYPGSTTVSTVNAGVVGMVRTLAIELAPVRVNSIHPGIVGDSPYWRDQPAAVLEKTRSATLTARLAAMRDVVAAVAFLLDNPSANDVNLVIDGGSR